MKIIHCADLHLDSKMETNLSVAKAKERKKEILNTFERMVDYAAEHHVDAIILAGDMFDTERVTNLTKTRVLKVIQKNSQIDFFYLSGNHDESNFIDQIEVVPENLKIFGKTWTSFGCQNIAITGVVLDESNQTSIYDTLNLSPENLNIVVMHGQISSYTTKDKNATINLLKLKNKNIDYLALGHVHTYMQGMLDKRGVYCYAGCLEGRGFDECGEKGFVLLEIQNGIIKSNFIGFAQRQLDEFVFDITGYDDWFVIENEVLTALKDYPKKDLIKIILRGKYNLQLEKHLGMLEQKLDKFYFAKIKDDSVLAVTSADVKNDISLFVFIHVV